MVPQVTVPRSLETLPARPPTPPREKALPVAAKQRSLLSPPSSLQTPPGLSPDSSDHSGAGSWRVRKKVGFSTQAEYCDAPIQTQKQPTPVSASSNASYSKPLKSILKPSPLAVINPLDPSGGADEATRHANIATMLESTTKQLAGADRASKLDAYMMLVRALKASNNLPDRIALQDKMSLFTQFIQRDITTKTASGELDSSLSNHASTLLITFLHYPAIASTLSNDFGVFIIDHCIRSFEDNTVPKDVARHLMQIVACQDFSPKVMTADRVGRLVSSLHHIEEHLKGKSIIMSRILIYRRLIKQAKSYMITHSDWLLDLFTDMLSNVKEIRTTAIALGLEACFSIGKEKQLSKRVMEILQLVVEETKYIEYYVERLKSMAASKDKNESSAVPQVWSVIILLMRCPVNRWDFFGPWLSVIQLCFNSSDFQTKYEANYAWNRLVYLLGLNEQTPSNLIKTICQPLQSQLKRKKQSEEFRRVVVGSICNLYYYAFRPNTGPSLVDSFWDSCVSQIIQKMITPESALKPSEQTPSPPDYTQQAAQILTGLFNLTTPRIWREDHIADSPLVKPDELPALDPKWVRRNAPRVFAVVEPILTKTFLELSDEESAPAKLWKALVGAVAFAASKEVKVSTDTSVFMAHTFTVLYRIWTRGIPDSGEDSETSRRFYQATCKFLTTVISSLGHLPFTEKQLSMGNGTFLPVTTPSPRPEKGQGISRAPLHHLFSILSTLPPGASDDNGLLKLLQTTLTPFFTTKTIRARVDLVHELIQSLPMDTLIPYGPWVIISEVLWQSLDSSQSTNSSTSSGSQPPVGHEYREIVKHLERGIRSTPNLPWEHWQSLFHSLTTRVVEKAGESGFAIAVTEPLAKAVLDIATSDAELGYSVNLFRSGIELISSAKQPRDRQAVDAARRRLWGTLITGSRSTSFDTYDGLYRLINYLLTTSYERYYKYETGGIIVPIITEVAGFLARCNRVLVFNTLTLLQDSIGIWIQDKDERYNSRQSLCVSEAVKLLWNSICNVFTETDSLELVQLDTIEPLLCSAFESKHKHIVSMVTMMWNKAFEHSDGVQYPERLKATLLSLHSYVDIILPGLDVASYESHNQQQQPAFVESQDDAVVGVSTRSRRKISTPQSDKPASSLRSTPRSVRPSVAVNRRPENTPVATRLRSRGRGATLKLRHDDSQIQFAAIESSSASHPAEQSQALTERQMEVRERQRESATLFPELRSSVERDEVLPEKTATPKSHRSFEDYVSSTPTPRRGQAAIVDHDHEMADDIPSSPPDPRRYPLLPEINKPLSSSSSVLDEWQFMSSPISGSPLSNRQMPPNQPMTTGPGVERHDTMDIDQPAVPVQTAGSSGDEGEHGYTEVHGDAEVEGEQENLPTVKSKAALKAPAQRPATPPNARNLKAQGTPRSDNEVFVDALSSPAHTPRGQRVLARQRRLEAADKSKGSQLKEVSFEASDVDERSMLRLVVELDSRKCDPLPAHNNDAVAAEPEQAGRSPGARDSPVLDCITVYTEGSQRSRSKRSKKKRKRASEKAEESESKKRRHSQEQDADAGADADVGVVPESQQLLDANDTDASLGHSRISGEEQQPGSSQESSSQGLNSDEHDAAAGGSPVCDSPVNEHAAVNMQIVQEASQHTEEDVSSSLAESLGDTPTEETAEETTTESTELPMVADQAQPEAVIEHVEVGMGEGREEEVETAGQKMPAGPETTVEKGTQMSEQSSMEKIMEALRGSLAELRTAALSREEVHQVEDTFMDIKRELYAAELRGRK